MALRLHPDLTLCGYGKQQGDSLLLKSCKLLTRKAFADGRHGRFCLGQNLMNAALRVLDL